MTSVTNPLTSPTAATASTTSGEASTAALGDETTFLQLLVAQIQNQDSNTYLARPASTHYRIVSESRMYEAPPHSRQRPR